MIIRCEIRNDPREATAYFSEYLSWDTSDAVSFESHQRLCR